MKWRRVLPRPHTPRLNSMIRHVVLGSYPRSNPGSHRTPLVLPVSFEGRTCSFELKAPNESSLGEQRAPTPRPRDTGPFTNFQSLTVQESSTACASQPTASRSIPQPTTEVSRHLTDGTLDTA